MIIKRNREGSKTSETFADEKFVVDSRYRILKLLGKGTYGTVVSALDTKGSREDGIPVAIKKVTRIWNHEVLLLRTIREVKLMKHFRGHRNIVNLIHLELSHQESDGLYCVQSLAEYDLAQVLYSSAQFSEFHIRDFFYQILCGLLYIHSANVIHRDLKPGNILVSTTGILKIGDFGLARGIHGENTGRRHSITNYVATRWYRAPEIMLSKGRYSKAVDIWAAGCIFSEFYGRRPLFLSRDSLQQLHEIEKKLGTPSRSIQVRYNWQGFKGNCYTGTDFKVLFPFAHNGAIEIMDKVLEWDPSTRWTVERVLKHQFFNPVRHPASEIKCSKLFDFTFENSHPSLRQLKTLLESEVGNFNRS